MNFSKIYNLSIYGHSDIDFVDILVNTDVRLYLDSERILRSEGIIAEFAKECLEDFFDVFMQLVRNNDREGLYKLLSYGHEPNETHLGMSSRKSCGKGSSLEIIMPIVDNIIELGYCKSGVVEKLSDLPLLTPNFSNDRFSDLVTNILRQVLHIFTHQQYDKLNIKYDDSKCDYKLPYWDKELHCWRTMNTFSFKVGGKPILLVPKTFVGTKLLLNPSQLLQKYALEYGQEDHYNAKSSICTIKKDRFGNDQLEKPTKKKVRKFEITNLNRAEKEYIAYQVDKHPDMLIHYHNDVNAMENNDIFISDEKLDKMLYASLPIAL